MSTARNSARLVGYSATDIVKFVSIGKPNTGRQDTRLRPHSPHR